MCLPPAISSARAIPLLTGVAAGSKARYAVNAFLKEINDNTKIVPGHGALASKANPEEYRDMPVTARDRTRKLRDEGKSEQEVVAAKPSADLAPNGIERKPAGRDELRNVYNSFTRSLGVTVLI